MNIDVEEKTLTVFTYLLVGMKVIPRLLKIEFLEWDILVLLSAVILALSFRKFSRDKKQGKPNEETFRLCASAVLLIISVMMVFIPEIVNKTIVEF